VRRSPKVLPWEWETFPPSSLDALGPYAARYRIGAQVAALCGTQRTVMVTRRRNELQRRRC